MKILIWGITRDRRTPDLLRRYNTIEQARADCWLQIGAANFHGWPFIWRRPS